MGLTIGGSEFESWNDNEFLLLRRIFGQKMDEVTGECRKLHNEEFRDL
jgi:hypothetical protein